MRTLSEADVKKGIRSAGNDRELCFFLLYDVLENGAFSNLSIKASEANGFVSAMFYGTVTRTVTIDFMVKHLAKADLEKTDPVTRTLIRMGAWQILFSDKVPPFAAVNSTVDLGKTYAEHSVSFINAVLRTISKKDSASKDPNNYKPEVATSLKSEIFGVLKKSYGRDEALKIGRALLRRPDISIRPNRLRTDKDTLIRILNEEGIKTKDGILPDSIRIEGGNIESIQSFKDGMFFVQNEAAQLASIIAAPHKGDRILDVCAAPGGKSTHMAELTGDEAEILSLDINESRLKLIDDNARRLGIKSIRTMQCDSTSLEGKIDGDYDIVLCDVPCSGLGLMGRKPDIRLTISYQRIEELIPKQKKILSGASKLVKKGGKLIYSTCTLNRRENEEVIQEFIQSHDDFVISDISSYLPDSIIMDEGGTLTLMPHKHGCDGFFVCRMERRES